MPTSGPAAVLGVPYDAASSFRRGPAAAPDQIRRAIATSDHALFTSISGIGKRTAERVVIDLKDKIGAPPASEEPAPSAPAGGHTAARDALVGLGMSVNEAEAALRNVDEELPVEERIRLALAGAV